MRKSTAIALLMLVGLAGTSIWLWHALVQERARADALQARSEFRESIPTTAAPDSSVALPSEARPSEQSGEVEMPPLQQDFAAYERGLLQNESYREARRRFRQLELTSGHLDLAKVLGISQETAQQLLAVLVDRELRYLSQPRPNPRNEEELRIRKQKIQQAEQEQDVEIAALIGQAKLAKWKDYQASLPVRHDVYRLGAKLFAIGEPLREDQIEPLVSAIHSERKRVKQELADYTASLVWTGGMEEKSHAYRNKRHSELTTAADSRIHAAASSILSPKQLGILDDMMRGERELQDARFQEWRAQGEASRISAGADPRAK